MNEATMKAIVTKQLGLVKWEEQLANYTSFKVGGVATCIVYPEDETKLIQLLKLLRAEQIKYKVLGNGSNVIFSDKPYEGVIIKLDRFQGLQREETVVTVGAGYDLMKLAYQLSNLGLSGLEFATGIPGTVGGAIFMNAGAYKADIGMIVERVRVLTPTLEIKELTQEDLEFGYRSSFLQKHPGYICLEAVLNLKWGDLNWIKALVKERKQKRFFTQPLEYPSAGSVFRNPPDDYAGRLIEMCGLKGKQRGGAQVSLKHANFIINYAQATAQEVYDLMMQVKAEVKAKTGVDLLIEQEFVNWE